MGLPDDLAQTTPILDSRISGAWDSEGMLTNPAAGDIGADTGALASGFYDVTFFIWNGSGGIEGYDIVRRNAANTADVNLQIVSVPSNDYLTTALLKNFYIEANERFVVRNRTVIVGVIQSSIIWSRRH